MLCSAVQCSPRLATQSAFLQTLHLLLSFLPSFLMKTHWVSFCSLLQPTAPLLLYAMYKFGKRIRPNEDASQGQRFLYYSSQLYIVQNYVAVVDWMTDVDAGNQLIPICITADLLRLLCKAFKLLMIEKAYMLNEPQGNTFIMSMPDEISLSIMPVTSQYS